ncbi:MAG: ABC transporter ATP-binding protein [Phycisphaerae bacterium]|nr:ATP-binding cassette domain-containing protein [Phycisphaerae bacterium]NUQ46106.1 ABC transporter ATP-binding protein [Phycisphaerae bacterium]
MTDAKPPITTHPLLAVHDLTVRYGPWDRRDGSPAVGPLSFTLLSGRTLGLVGESGCGKTTLARAILRLVPVQSGAVLLDGRDVLSADRKTLRSMRRMVQMVFQDPYTSLNPRHTIERIVREGLDVHEIGAAAERGDRVAELLRQVGLPADCLGRFPQELSGGQRQRVAIARALAVGPRLLVLDEPVSALDVSVQALILNLLAELQSAMGIAYLFVGHHLGVVRQVSHEIAVMREGRIVEWGPADHVLTDPQDEYTRSLLSSVLEPTLADD